MRKFRIDDKVFFPSVTSRILEIKHSQTHQKDGEDVTYLHAVAENGNEYYFTEHGKREPNDRNPSVYLATIANFRTLTRLGYELEEPQAEAKKKSHEFAQRLENLKSRKKGAILLAFVTDDEEEANDFVNGEQTSSNYRFIEFHNPGDNYPFEDVNETCWKYAIAADTFGNFIELE